MQVRYATAEDATKWFQVIPATMRAVVVEHEGRLLGFAGIGRMGDHMQAFSAIKDELRGHRYVMAKAAWMMRQMMKDIGGPIFAVCSEKEPTAPGLLASLGFRPYADRVWRWN